MHRHTSTVFSTAAIVTLCAFAPTGCDASDEPEAANLVAADELPGPADEPDEASDATPFGAENKRFIGGDVLEDVVLEGGTRVTFIALPATSGGRPVGVIEEIPIGAPSLADFAELADASVPAMFWAVTDPGTPMPAPIAALKGAGEELGAQGWALDAIAEGRIVKPRSGTCDSDAVFTNFVTGPGYTYDVLRLNRHPDVSSVFIDDDYAPGNGMLLDGYMYSPNGVDNGSRFFGITAYYSRVGVCRISGHSVVDGWEVGPWVRFDYAQGGGWVNAFSRDVDWGDDDVTFAVHWSDDEDFNARTRIEMAAWDDIYDIGHAYEL